MKLSIKQAIERGIEAHKAGKPQEAERFYHAVLELQPTNSVANYLLGRLAASEDKTDKALSLFRTALQSKPKKQWYWVNYIDNTIKAKQFDEAEEALTEAMQLVFPNDQLIPFKEKITSQRRNC